MSQKVESLRKPYSAWQSPTKMIHTNRRVLNFFLESNENSQTYAWADARIFDSPFLGIWLEHERNFVGTSRHSRKPPALEMMCRSPFFLHPTIGYGWLNSLAFYVNIRMMRWLESWCIAVVGRHKNWWKYETYTAEKKWKNGVSISYSPKLYSQPRHVVHRATMPRSLSQTVSSNRQWKWVGAWSCHPFSNLQWSWTDFLFNNFIDGGPRDVKF